MKTGQRNTLNKAISAAPTFAQKWKIAITGGAPVPTELQLLARTAAILRSGCPSGEDWKKWHAGYVKDLEAEFVKLLFPALMKGDPLPFIELERAMGDCRRGNLDFQQDLRRKSKMEDGRRLRLALLTLEPEDRVSMKTVAEALSRLEIEASDRSHLGKVMREIPINLLVPGQKCIWSIKGKVVRELVFNCDGTLTNRGLSRNKLGELRGKWVSYQELIPRNGRRVK